VVSCFIRISSLASFHVGACRSACLVSRGRAGDSAGAPKSTTGHGRRSAPAGKPAARRTTSNTALTGWGEPMPRVLPPTNRPPSRVSLRDGKRPRSTSVAAGQCRIFAKDHAKNHLRTNEKYEKNKLHHFVVISAFSENAQKRLYTCCF
jgi:hypothetical protein